MTEVVSTTTMLATMMTTIAATGASPARRAIFKEIFILNHGLKYIVRYI